VTFNGNNPIVYRYTRLSLVVLLLAGGCSSGKSGIAPGTLASSKVKILDTAGLRRALLRLDELPAGYSFSAEQSPEPDVSPSRPTRCERLFEEFGNTSTLGDGTAGANAVFEKSAVGPFLQLELASYADAAALRRSLSTVRDAVGECGQFATTDPDGSKFTVQIAAVSFPALGDETAAFKLDATGVSGETAVALSGFLVAVRVARTVCTIVHFGLPTVDLAETEQVARKAVDKLTPVAR
jgi:hypothetical protein